MALLLQAKVSELKAAACALWGVKAEDVELLDWYNNAVHCSLEGADKADKALKDVSILDNQYILLGMEVGLITAPAAPPLLAYLGGIPEGLALITRLHGGPAGKCMLTEYTSQGDLRRRYWLMHPLGFLQGPVKALHQAAVRHA